MQYTIKDLLEIMEKLRGENGCPWDMAQTHDSLKKTMIEETYEVIDALELEDDKMFANELGDLLLHIVFHAQIAKERDAFDFNDVVNEICTKLISRHSHIFGDDKCENVDDVLDVWEKNKRKEKFLQTDTDMLNDVPHALPALMRAQKVQRKAASVGFDWESFKGAFEKLKEEMNEFEAAVESDDKENVEEELGDLLFTVVNISRFVDVDSEIALMKSINKFILRFAKMEYEILNLGKTVEDMKMSELDSIWNKIKH